MFLFMSLFILLFSLYSVDSQLVQVTGMIFFIFAGAIAFFKAKGKNKNLTIDGATLLICILIPVFSLIVLGLNQQIDLIPQTLAFMFCGFSARLIITIEGLKKTIKIIIYTCISITLVTFILEINLLINSLSFAVDENGGRIRFNPFNNHPNLTGHIFGIVFLCCAIYSFWYQENKTKFWFVTFFTSFMSLIFIAAASSRGAILATIAGILSVLATHLLRNNEISKKLMKYTAIGAGALVVVMVFNTDVIVSYFSEQFELNSEYRGANSGMSGRTENWPLIINLSLENFSGTAFGHGIRSWDDATYDMSTDSSYVNQLWESGLILTLALIILLVKKIKIFAKSIRTFEVDLYFSLLVFATVESIVARYLLGIGNPASIIILLILLTPDDIVIGRMETYSSFINYKK